ncbi:MAG: glycosyltransferase [Actinomycetota bacterium]|nr:glycosyltransferase [Actinomycetota bacterium]
MDVVRSSSWLVAASTTMAAGNALFNLVLARLGGPAHYSLAYPLLALGTSSAAIGVGLQYATTQSVLNSLSQGNASRTFGSSLRAATALMLVLLACTVPLARELHAPNTSYVTIADLLFAATFALAAATGYLVALRRYVAIAAISLTSALLRIACFLAVVRWTVVRGSLAASVLAIGLAAAAMYVYGRRKGPLEVPLAPVRAEATVSSAVAISFLLAALLALPSFEARHFLPDATAGDISTALLFATGISVIAGPIATSTYRSLLLGESSQLVRSGARVTVLVGLVGVIGLSALGPGVASVLYRHVPGELPALLLLVGLAATVQALVGFLTWSSLARGEALRPWVLGLLGGLAAEAAAIAAWHSTLGLGLATLLGPSAALVAGAASSSVTRLRQEAGSESPATSRRLLSQQVRDLPSAGGVPVSVGVLAHNEHEMLAMTVNGFLAQLHGRTFVDEVVVIVSGSTDGTPRVAEEIAATDDRVRLVVQPERRGKLQAVEDFLHLARNDICVESSGDVVPDPDVVERLCFPLLEDPEVGMSGPRVVSERLSLSFVSRMHQVLWHLHDHVAAQSPKIGETFAVRRQLVGELPPVAGCDEVLVEAAVTAAGAKLVYARDAVVHNFAPTSLGEYFDHRRRIHLQHLLAAATISYRPSTFPLANCLRAIAIEATAHPSALPAIAACAVVEALARALARRDVAVGETALTWSRTASSRLTVQDALAERQLTP